MKITWDNIDHFKLNKNGNFGKWNGKRYTGSYILVYCIECNEQYFTNNRKSVFCSHECRSKNIEYRSKMSKCTKGKNNPMYGISRYGENNPFYNKTHTNDIRKLLSNINKGKEPSNKIYKNITDCSYNTYSIQLQLYGIECKRSKNNEMLLEVQCMYCGKWYKPSRTIIRNIIQLLKKDNKYKFILLCSDKCKFNSPLFKKIESGLCWYDTYVNKLKPYGIKCKKSKNGTLEVQCMYCGKWYQPIKWSIHNKIQCIKGNGEGEQNLYCSDQCKQACPTYGKVLYPKGFKVNTSREVQPHLRKLVLKRDNYTCQKCGCDDKQLHCHHITGIELNPVESADIDNCITLCIDCHHEVHKQPECNMRRKEC